MKECFCPNCGAKIPMNTASAHVIFCAYCGTRISLDDFQSTNIYVDEAKVKEAETERMIRLKELEIESKNQEKIQAYQKVLFPIWLVISVVLVGASVIAMLTNHFIDGFVTLVYGGGIVVGGGAYLIFKFLPSKIHGH